MAKKEKYVVSENEIVDILPEEPNFKKGQLVFVKTRRDIDGKYFPVYYTYYDVLKVSEGEITIGKGKDPVATVRPCDIEIKQ